MRRLLAASALAVLATIPDARADMSLAQYREIKQGSVDIVVGDEALFYLAGALDGIRIANTGAAQNGIALFCLPPDTDLSLGGLDDMIEKHIEDIRQSRPDAEVYYESVSVGTALLVVLNREYPCRFDDEQGGKLPTVPGLTPNANAIDGQAPLDEAPPPENGGRVAQ